MKKVRESLASNDFSDAIWNTGRPENVLARLLLVQIALEITDVYTTLFKLYHRGLSNSFYTVGLSKKFVSFCTARLKTSVTLEISCLLSEN